MPRWTRRRRCFQLRWTPTNRPAETTVLAVILMVVAAPLAAGAYDRDLRWTMLGMIILGTKFELTPSIMGKIWNIFLDLILVILMTVIPLKCYEVVSKLSKNRNPVIPATLTGVVDFILAVILFCSDLARRDAGPDPCDLSVYSHSLGADFDWRCAGSVHRRPGSPSYRFQPEVLRGIRICLKKMRPAAVSLDYAENALALLNRRVRARHAPAKSIRGTIKGQTFRRNFPVAAGSGENRFFGNGNSVSWPAPGIENFQAQRI